MALGYAKAQLLGNVVRDIEIKTTSGGKNVGTFTLAVNKTKDKVAYLDCVAWEKTAELIQNYATKGTKLLVIGDIDQQTWEKDGQKRSKIEFKVDDFRLLGGGENRPLQQHEALEKSQDVVPEDIDDKPIDLSEIPF